MNLDRRSVIRATGNRNLELAREERKLGVQGRPLPQDLAVDAGIDNLIRGGTSEFVRGHIANTIAAGLDRVHVDHGQGLQDIGSLFELRPIILDILARREMAVATIKDTGNMPKLAQLCRT